MKLPATPGRVVTLPGNSPLMVVDHVRANGLVDCEWHDSTGTNQSAQYPAEILRDVSVADADNSRIEEAISSERIVVGELVQLVTGGPVMTVAEIFPVFRTALCVWANSERVPCSRVYARRILCRPV